ncbi:metallo-beta-lactamase family protein [Saitoella complicata NRRL Y-17804]|uniref:metallo-beta-lactamase family protein n=1 Tax=Saitoella complicata (strain BCRC 22490 / CBS 7301 / JCM 7358 / NBRC 10748 / NRRL Y-17804) TaxID=698492 RepID=UPI00086752A7|nr:metallo-beta-lactamase family protein [Saitoella complicata NRRL Y-17804]ODQ53921.1 metallo-beta-lactamase family protein [Saitoella complicata NRRL Y-17804]
MVELANGHGSNGVQHTAKAESIIFLGTGTSSAVPVIGCLTQENPACEVCISAMDPKSKNRRLNTGAVITIDVGEPTRKNLVIDCGKTFYHAALAQFPRHKLRRVDAVLLTHAHADAFFGLDDLRGWTLGGLVQDTIDVYVSKETMDTIALTFPYMVSKDAGTGGGDLPQFNWHVFDPTKSFRIPSCGNIEVTPLLVEHGRYFSGVPRPFMSLGFRVDGLSYISDVSAVPPTTAQLLHGTKVFVLDGLKDAPHASHFSIGQAVDFVRTLPEMPSKTFLVGFTHESTHEALERRLEGVQDFYVRPAFDGKRIKLIGGYEES